MVLSNAERQARYRERLIRMATEAPPVRVRVFFPSHDPDFDYLGEDREFGAMPRPGEEIRLTSRPVSHIVERAGHIEDGDTFVPAVWLGPEIDS